MAERFDRGMSKSSRSLLPKGTPSGISYRGVSIPIWEIVIELILLAIIVFLIWRAATDSQQPDDCACANRTDLTWLWMIIVVILSFVIGLFWGRHLKDW